MLFLAKKREINWPNKKQASAKGQFYEALELFEITKVESVFGGLYSPRAPLAAKRVGGARQ